MVLYAVSSVMSCDDEVFSPQVALFTERKDALAHIQHDVDVNLLGVYHAEYTLEIDNKMQYHKVVVYDDDGTSEFLYTLTEESI